MMTMIRLADYLLAVAVAVVWSIGAIAIAQGGWALSSQPDDGNPVIMVVTPQHS